MVALYRGVQLVLSKTIRIGGTKMSYLVYTSTHPTPSRLSNRNRMDPTVPWKAGSADWTNLVSTNGEPPRHHIRTCKACNCRSLSYVYICPIVVMISNGHMAFDVSNCLLCFGVGMSTFYLNNNNKNKIK